MRKYILMIFVAGIFVLGLYGQNSDQEVYWQDGYYHSPRFVVIDTASLFDRPLLLAVHHPKFDDSDVSISNIQIISPLSVSDSVIIKPGDVIILHLQQWGKTLIFPQDTFRFDVMYQVTQTWWIQKHRESNWYPLSEAVHLRFDSVAILEIAAAVQDSS